MPAMPVRCYLAFLVAIFATAHGIIIKENHRRTQSNGIRPLPCQSRYSTEEGVCMFAWNCMVKQGTHLSPCFDGIFIGSCCKMSPDAISPDEQNEVLPDISLKPFDETSKTTIRPHLTSTPGLITWRPSEVTTEILNSSTIHGLEPNVLLNESSATVNTQIVLEFEDSTENLSLSDATTVGYTGLNLSPITSTSIVTSVPVTTMSNSNYTSETIPFVEVTVPQTEKPEVTTQTIVIPLDFQPTTPESAIKSSSTITRINITESTFSGILEDTTVGYTNPPSLPTTLPNRPLTTRRPVLTTIRPKPSTTRPRPSTARPKPSTVRPRPTTRRPIVRPRPTTKAPITSTRRPPPTSRRPIITSPRPRPTTRKPVTTTQRYKPTTQGPPSTTSKQTTTSSTTTTTTPGTVFTTLLTHDLAISSTKITTSSTIEIPTEKVTPLPSTTISTTTESTTTTARTTTQSSATTKVPIPLASPPISMKPFTNVPASTLSTATPTIIVPLENSTDNQKYKEICGKPNPGPQGRVVGGVNARYAEWPWMISLRQLKKNTFLHKCGAALLNEFWAITAAHCVESVTPGDLLLRLGEYDITNEKESEPYEERRVQIIASHPKFDPRTFEYDLALLRFYEPVRFRRNIIPICLPLGEDMYVGKMATVTGWGRLYEDGPLPNIMQEVHVPVLTNKDCEKMYRNAGFVEDIPDIFICSGYIEGGKDSCEGDSGGPMVLKDGSRWILAGVISWGIGCALPNQPGVYSRITKFSEWINQIIAF